MQGTIDLQRFVLQKMQSVWARNPPAISAISPPRAVFC